MKKILIKLPAKTNIILFLFSLITTTTLYFDLTIPITEWFNNGIEANGNNITSLITFVFLYFFYAYSFIKLKSYRTSMHCIIPAALFSLFMIFGYSFSKQNNWFLVIDGFEQFFTSLLRFIGYFILFLALICCIFSFVDNCNIFNRKNSQNNTKFIPILSKVFSYIEKKPFLTSIIILFIAYIPYMILSYPALVSYDSILQISQIKEGIPNNNHPITHSYLIYLCLKLGEILFSSHNIGLFIYSFLQEICFIAVISYFIKVITGKGISTKISCCVILYYILSPWCQNLMYFITKDVFYSTFLILFCLWIFQIYDSGVSIKKTILLILISLGVILFRNEGKYIIVLTLFCCCFLIKNARKALSVTALCAILFCIILSHIIFPYFQIEPGSRREMLSIPFQQTARYVRDAYDDITPEEKKAISAVLDFDSIGQKYFPELSDCVKSTYHAASKKDIIPYLKAWWTMFLKHPGIYIQATMNNTYSYFYPEYYTYYLGHKSLLLYPYSTYSLPNIIALNEKTGTNVHYYRELDSLRNFYQRARVTFASLPIFTLFCTPAFYTWLMILFAFYSLKKKKRCAYISMIPLVFALMVYIAGPTNATYFRYIYSIAMSLPIGLVLCLYIIKQKIKGE